MSDNETENKTASRGGTKATDTGAAKAAKAQLAEVEGVKQTDPTNAGDRPEAITTAGVGPDAVVLGVDEELDEALLSAVGGEQFVTLDKDVVEEFRYPGTVRPAYRILYSRGQTIARSVIDQLNAGVKARREAAARDGVDESNPAGVDATTLASGTYPGLAASEKK